MPRADGRGNEIKGVTQAQMDAYSTRTVQVHEKERELARAWERRHGRAPNSRELYYITQKATLLSRKGKDAGQIDWDALAQRWDATIGGELAHIAPAVSNARGPDGSAPAAGGRESGSPEADGPPSREEQARAVQKALALVAAKQSTWTRHDLLKQLALVMPPQTRQMSPQAAQELLLGLADEALSGRIEDVVSLEAPEWPPLPGSLRRELDGRSVYTRPGTARYATAAQLSAEERLVAQAQTQGAPRLPGELAARRLGADRGAAGGAAARARAGCAQPGHATRAAAGPGRRRLARAHLGSHRRGDHRPGRDRQDPGPGRRGARLDRASRLWAGVRHRDITERHQRAPQRRCPGIGQHHPAAGRHRRSIPPGSLIVVDEGSMVSLAHLSALVDYAARNGCKLVLAGDQEQLAAVEGGGAMMLLADRLGYVQLAEPVRFTAAWERDASLRLRRGDATALDDYDQHGRIRGAPPDQAMDQAVKAYVASYLAGRDVILTAADWARCRELSARIRDDLIHLGLVDNTRTVPIAEGAEASVGDLIICRQNDHTVEAGEPGRALANGDILRIEAITSQRRDGPPPARARPGDRAAALHRPGVLLSRLPHMRPGVRDHRAFRPGRHGAHRDHAGHRQRRPPVAVPGDDPRHRHQHGIRVHHPAQARRPAARHPARPRAGPLRTHPARTRGVPARARPLLPGRAARTRGNRSPYSPTCSTATAPSCPPPRPGSATWPTPTTSPS